MKEGVGLTEEAEWDEMRLLILVSLSMSFLSHNTPSQAGHSL